MFGRIVHLARPALVQQQNVRNMATLNDVRQLATKNVQKLIASGYLSELRPPLPTEIPRALVDLVRLFTRANWRNVTVREAWLNTLVTTEVVCWFFVGECIGKGNLIGYQV